MITEKELIRVNDLRYQLNQLEDLNRSFGQMYVRCKIGLIKYLDDNSIGKEAHEKAEYFDTEFKEQINEMQDKIIKEIQVKINHVKAELSRYIKE